MARTHFIPARDSRHHTAVVALYRALAKTANKVTIPEHIGATPSRSSPIQLIIRRRFEKNSKDTSPRLVFAALTAGYKFLSFLNKSLDVNSDEYRQIVRHLSRRGKLPTPPATSSPTEKATEAKEPLLIKAFTPGETPKYTSNRYPRPLNSLTRPRRVPMLATTAEGLPFLRTSPSQPHDMSRMIGRKNKIFKSKIFKISEIQDELMPDAEAEDRWERLVARQLREEGLPVRETASGDVEESYTWSLYLSRLWIEWKIEVTWQDWIARGEALQRIVDAEQDLADQEAGRTRKPEPTTDHARPAATVNVSGRAFSSLTPPELQGKSIRMDGHDIFASDTWAAVVRSRHGMLRSWADKAQTQRSTV